MCVHLVVCHTYYYNNLQSSNELKHTLLPLSPRDPSNRLPVLRVLVVRVTGALMLQVGVVVARGGVGVVAVLVDLIQTSDGSKNNLI